MESIKMFIGFDQVESIAYHVFECSIQRKTNRPVSVTPVRLSQLKEVLTRPRHPLQSNEFAFSRWLVPWMCDYKGWAIFADCDMLCRGDINDLWKLRDDKYSVMVVKHDHRPKERTKYLDQAQIPYERKNWSSVMMFNCEKCKMLSPEYVNEATGLQLHQFRWLSGEGSIGSLPPEWNHLVGYDEPDNNTKIAHFTSGGPYFDEYYGCEFSEEWVEELKMMTHCEQRSKVKQA